MSLEERADELHKAFAATPEIRKSLHNAYAPWSYDLEDDYNQVQWLWTERGFTGLHNDATMKNIFIDLELFIEEYIGKKHITEKKMNMYKGTVKKWQVLDDSVYDVEEIRKIQAAIKAPRPEELDMYKEKHDKQMILPITNVNVSEWRDDKIAADSADFD